MGKGKQSLFFYRGKLFYQRGILKTEIIFIEKKYSSIGERYTHSRASLTVLEMFKCTAESVHFLNKNKLEAVYPCPGYTTQKSSVHSKIHTIAHLARVYTKNQ